MKADEHLTLDEINAEIQRVRASGSWWGAMIIALILFLASSCGVIYQVANGQGFSLLVTGLSGWLIVLVFLGSGLTVAATCWMMFSPKERQERAQRSVELQALRARLNDGVDHEDGELRD